MFENAPLSVLECSSQCSRTLSLFSSSILNTSIPARVPEGASLYSRMHHSARALQIPFYHSCLRGFCISVFCSAIQLRSRSSFHSAVRNRAGEKRTLGSLRVVSTSLPIEIKTAEGTNLSGLISETNE